MADTEYDANRDELFRIETVLESLPHRYPFLFVDTVTEAVPGKRAVAVLRVTADSPYLGIAGATHLPGVLIIEAMAQVGAVCAAGAGGPAETGVGGRQKTQPVRGYLAAINDAEFKGRVSPGDTVRLTLEYVARMGNMVRFNGSAHVEGKEIISCGLTFTVEA